MKNTGSRTENIVNIVNETTMDASNTAGEPNMVTTQVVTQDSKISSTITSHSGAVTYSASKRKDTTVDSKNLKNVLKLNKARLMRKIDSLRNK